MNAVDFRVGKSIIQSGRSRLYLDGAIFHNRQSLKRNKVFVYRVFFLQLIDIEVFVFWHPDWIRDWKKNMRSIIVDDNSIERDTIACLAARVPGVRVLAEFSRAQQAYDFLQTNPVDLIFLDIEMPGMNGIELTRSLGGLCPAILFTTSKKGYALEAFELNVIDYLMKPILPERFLQALDKVRLSWRAGWEIQREHYGGDVFLKEGNIIRRVALAEICIIEAMGDYVKIHVSDKFFTIHTTLKSLEGKLPAERFLRIHRSYIIALDKVDYVQESTLRICGKFIPIAESYRKNLIKKMPLL